MNFKKQALERRLFLFMKTIIKDIDEINQLNLSFHDRIKYGKSSWAHWGECNEFINYNILSLDSVLLLCQRKRYRDCFLILRSVYEQYFYLSVLMLADRAKIVILNENNESNFIQKIEKLIEKIKDKKPTKIFLNKKRAEFYLDNSFVSGSTDRISPYYFIWIENDSVSWRFSDFPLRGADKLDKSTKNKFKILDEAVKWKSLLESCVENNLLNEKQQISARVHYSFLSSFVHGEERSFRSVHSNQLVYINEIVGLERSNKLIELLIYLYTLFLSTYFLSLQLKYFKRQSIKGIKREKSLQHRISEVSKKYFFFWFIHNDPSPFEKFHDQMYRTWDEYEPETKDEVRYYAKPMNYLSDMCTGWSNPILGKYRPPRTLLRLLREK